MTRLPNLYAIYERGGLKEFESDYGDDLCIGPDGYKFADGAVVASKFVRVSRERGAKYDDPIAAFQPLCKGFAFMDGLAFRLDPSRASTRQRFPFVDEAWFELQVICTLNHATPSVVFFYPDPDRREGLIPFPAWNDSNCFYSGMDPRDETRAALKRAVCGLQRMVAYAYLTFRDTGPVFIPRPVTDLREILQNFVNDKTSGTAPEAEWLVGDGVSVAVVYGAYDRVVPFVRKFVSDHADRVQCYIAPPDRRLYAAYQDPRWLSTPTAPRELMPRVWVPSAHLRWCFHHESIVALGLTLGMYLPPYALLEIVEWMPCMGKYNRVKKIGLLESVTASIRRLGKAPRWLTSE